MSNKLLITDKTLVTSKSDKIIYIKESNYDLVKYFMKSHKRARKINNKILNNNNQSSLLLSLLKLGDVPIYEVARILNIIDDYKEFDITVDTKYNKLLKYIILLEKLDFKKVNIIDRGLEKLKIKFYLKYIVAWIIMVVNSIFIKKKHDKNIFSIYNTNIAYDFIEPYQKDVVVYGSLSPNIYLKPKYYSPKNYIKFKYITVNKFFKGIRNIYNNIKIVNKMDIDSELKNIFISYLFPLETQNMIYLSLKDKFINLTNLLGMFDTNSAIDYVTDNLNKIGIKTICIPHGINYIYKVNYISLGTNMYTFWSKNHYNRIMQSLLIKPNNTKLKITGNYIYTKTLKHRKITKKSKKILVVGEYFEKNIFYSSPFNKKNANELLKTLSEFAKKNQDCSILIRTRIDDEYAQIAKNYLSNNIKLSSPKNPLIDEINEHDLIISIFSNALHEALLLNKKVLQVNLLGIENYRTLANDGLVYYADTIDALNNKLKKWYNGELKDLDYERHLREYCNNGVFEKIKLD